MKSCSVFHYLFFLFTIFLSVNAAAQNAKRTYYDANWKSCDAAKACYLSDILKTDSGYYRKDFFVNNGALQMAALYEDEACKTGNGYATYFYADGNLQRKTKMVHGKTEGINVGYYHSGVMSDSGSYHEGQPVGAAFRWHTGGTLSDSVAASTDSVRVHVEWFEDGSPAAAGREVNGKPMGVWVYYHRNGSRAAREVYENGKPISIQQYDETGKEIPLDTTRNERAASFKTGLEGWREYLEGALVWPQGYKFPNVSQIVVQVQMTIDEEGKIKDVYVMNPIHPAFDKVAYNAIRSGPVWQPAIQHNRPVEYRFRQSVTFAQPQ